MRAEISVRFFPGAAGDQYGASVAQLIPSLYPLRIHGTR